MPIDSLNRLDYKLNNIKIFPDYNNVIETINSEGVYTANQDCYIIGRMVPAYDEPAYICFGDIADNNKLIGCSNANTTPFGVCFILKKDDCLYIKGDIINLSVIGIK